MYRTKFIISPPQMALCAFLAIRGITINLPKTQTKNVEIFYSLSFLPSFLITIQFMNPILLLGFCLPNISQISLLSIHNSLSLHVYIFLESRGKYIFNSIETARAVCKMVYYFIFSLTIYENFSFFTSLATLVVFNLFNFCYSGSLGQLHNLCRLP